MEKIKIKPVAAQTGIASVKMPLVALRGLVMFPKMTIHFELGRDKSQKALDYCMKGNRRLFLTAQKNMRTEEPKFEDLYDVGTVVEVKQVIKNTGDNIGVMVEGLYRAKVTELLSEKPFFEVLCDELPLKARRPERSAMTDALMRTIKNQFEVYSYLSPRMPKELAFSIFSCEDPVELAEYVAGNLPIKIEDKQKLLCESSVLRRLELLASILEKENEILSLEQDIYDKVRGSMNKNQREYYLREQIKAINSELDQDEDADELTEYRKKIARLGLEGEAKEKLFKEVDKIAKMGANSYEVSVIRGYLDTCLELPWNKETKDRIDIDAAKKILDKDHYGLSKVKERILEILAVRKLVPDIHGQIICLVGPPGVGKTSIARSIARALKRKYVRISLGGVRDESDIRGHRKTYIGAMPGRIINALKLAKSKNPVMLLDEIDKMGNDFRGDPASAMLEVLDAEQNVAFRDHYIEIPFDLSDVLFITTANTTETIPPPLLDRMEVIYLSTYTREEKFQIAKRHLLLKQQKKHGVAKKAFKITDDAIYSLIDHYTRESGVRNLEREIGSLCRKGAKKLVDSPKTGVVIDVASLKEYLGPKKFKIDQSEKDDEIGLVNGLAWTSVGGELMQIEVAIMDGTGKLELTGSLGDVMKESAKAAISFIRSASDMYSIDKDFYKNKDIHIHVPEGAVPKDGPSAGITITTALVSALTSTPVKHDVAMTGEVTLRGRVLPIGGLKNKTMAAYQAGIKTVIIPSENEPDLDEIDDVVKDNIHFITANKIDTVLENALSKRTIPS